MLKVNNLAVLAGVLLVLISGCSSTTDTTTSTSSLASTTTTTAASTTTSATTTTTTTSTTTSTTVSGGSIIIKGLAIDSASGAGVSALAAVGNAQVAIGYPVQGSSEPINIAFGQTNASGNYSIQVPTAELQSVKGDNGYTANLIVTVTKEGLTIGCVIPSVSDEANRENIAPSADPHNFAKQKVAKQCFKKLIDPKTFDYNSNITQNFSGDTLKDLSDTQLGEIADSIKDTDNLYIASASNLGISPEIISLMQKKAIELQKIYFDPIYQIGYQGQTDVSQAQLDNAGSSMEVAMSDYLASLGVTNQQVSDLKSLADNKLQNSLQQNFGPTDPIFTDTEKRTLGNKMMTFFINQWDAANVAANLAPAGKQKYSEGKPANYAAFLSSKQAFINTLNGLINAGTSPEVYPQIIQQQFFSVYLLSNSNPTDESTVIGYFMNIQLKAGDQPAFEAELTNNVQLVSLQKVSSPECPYYMGEQFWATNPSNSTIQTRLGLYKDDLNAKIYDNSTLRTLLGASGAGFSLDDTNTLLKAFLIIATPPSKI